ncbi:MAG: gamma carbonic anhydrase family protein [Bacteroidia bacterium]|nr:gamma carbonic anhydrase family protein [Bacteroidia bacterium]
MPIIRPFLGLSPKIHLSAFIAENATIIGDVELAAWSSVWYNAVLRGDVGKIAVGARSNIQDGVVIHSTAGYSTVQIGEDVTIGHSAILHGCVIGNCVLIGMGAIVLDNAIIPDNCMVAAGSVVSERSQLESGFLYAGIPAKKIKPLTEQRIQSILLSAFHYVENAKNYR